jgi:hypothetical protein
MNLKPFLAELVIFCVVCVSTGGLVYAADTAAVTATVTAQNISVSVSDGTVSYGTMAVSTYQTTLPAGVNDAQTATNNGNVTEDFNIKGQNSANWTLAGTPGPDAYEHQFCNDTDNDCSNPPTTPYTDMTTNYTTLDTGIPPSGTNLFQLRLGTPTVSTNFTAQSVDVTVQAVAN